MRARPRRSITVRMRPPNDTATAPQLGQVVATRAIRPTFIARVLAVAPKPVAVRTFEA